MRRKLIAGNWKMNGLKDDGFNLAVAVADVYKAVKNPAFDMFVAPPFTLVAGVADLMKESGVMVGGQDCSMHESGAHTGDISPLMLRDAGCRGVIVGHSERRTDHHETDAEVKAKATAAINTGLTAIVCVGETLAQREAGDTLDVVGGQVRNSMPDASTAENVVIAYEPVWAIGTGKVPTSEEVEQVHSFIRSQITDVFGATIADKMRILYGGSVKPSNAKELLGLPNVDGALIGGASLKVADFWAIAETQLKDA